jgi:hypothetical protein
MSANDVIVSFVCPLLGMLVANVMWLSPLTVVLKARRVHSLGVLNPTPWAITWWNCIAWSGYALTRKDYLLFFANCTGAALGLFYSITALSILYSPHINDRGKGMHATIETLILGSIPFYAILFFLIVIVFPTTSVTPEVGAQMVSV